MSQFLLLKCRETKIIIVWSIKVIILYSKEVVFHFVVWSAKADFIVLLCTGDKFVKESSWKSTYYWPKNGSQWYPCFESLILKNTGNLNVKNMLSHVVSGYWVSTYKGSGQVNHSFPVSISRSLQTEVHFVMFAFFGLRYYVFLLPLCVNLFLKRDKKCNLIWILNHLICLQEHF